MAERTSYSSDVDLTITGLAGFSEEYNTPISLMNLIQVGASEHLLVDEHAAQDLRRLRFHQCRSRRKRCELG